MQAQLAAPVVGNKPSYAPEISSTGRYVVFASDATNLVAGDTNGRRDIFLRDTVSKTTRLVSKPKSGGANGNSYAPQVSDDGRYVAYLSDATNLVSGDTNGVTDLFRFEVATGAVTRVSQTVLASQVTKPVSAFGMSANGASFVFLPLEPGYSRGEVYLRDLPARARLLGDGSAPSISPNGKLASYVGGNWDRIQLWSRATGVTKELETNQDVTEIATSNAGVSYAWAYWDGWGDASQWDITASPSSLSFSWSPDDYGSPVGKLELSTWGAMFATQDPSKTGMPLIVVDNTGVLYRKAVSIRNGQYAMAGNGKTVVYALKTGQIVAWSLATGATQTVSVSS